MDVGGHPQAGNYDRASGSQRARRESEAGPANTLTPTKRTSH